MKRAVSIVALLACLSGPAGAETTQLFRFHNDAQINLHHLLVHWAAAEADRRPHWIAPLIERDAGLAALTADERAAWTAAVGDYGRAVDRSLVFDQGLVAVRDAIAGAAPRDAVPEDDRILLDALERALPVYRTHWWPRHEWLNRDWIEALLPELRRTEGAIARRLATAYGGSWPEGRLRVDVVAHANDVGAYSIGGILTIAAREAGNRMPFALEMIFHEASHVDPLEEPWRSEIEAAFEAEGGSPPERLWHDMIFFTSADATRLELGASGKPGYEHFGAFGEFGVYARGEHWPKQLAAFERHWRPFLESGSDDPEARRRALRAVARALSR